MSVLAVTIHRHDSSLRPRIVMLFCVAAFALGGLAHGSEGYWLFGIGAIQKAMGGAGAAAPRDASWLLLNPAALVDLERRLDFIVEYLSIRQSLTPRGNPLLSNPFARSLRDRNDVPFPSFGVVWPTSRGTVAFGAYGVGGQRVAFRRPRATLGLLDNGDRSVDVLIAKVPVSFSRRMASGWALGAAVIPAAVRFRTDTLTPAIRTARGNNGWDHALGIGFSVSAYRRWTKWSVGAAYSTPTWMESLDRYEEDLPGGHFDLPQHFQGGAAFRPIESLELALDYKWIDWSGIDVLANRPLQGGLHWRDQHIVKAGLTWNVSDRWTLRGGVSIGRAPVRSEAVFVNGLSPAVSEVHLGAGLSVKTGNRSTLHLTYAQALPEGKTDNGRGGLISHLGRGSRIGFREQSMTVQYSLRF